MQRETIRFYDRQADAVDDLVDNGEYPNKSEVYREAVDEFLAQRGEPVEGARPLIADGGER